jgi:hypothetical protein
MTIRPALRNFMTIDSEKRIGFRALIYDLDERFDFIAFNMEFLAHSAGYL